MTRPGDTAPKRFVLGFRQGEQIEPQQRGCCRQVGTGNEPPPEVHPFSNKKGVEQSTPFVETELENGTTQQQTCALRL